MFADMLPALQSAQKSIYVESFIIGMGEMWGQIHEILRRKAAQGLDVRVCYDDAGCLSLLPHNYDETLRAEGIRAFSFNRCVPLLNLVMNNRDHRKIMVIDGRIAFTGGVNLADEYINKLVRFGYWKDSGVRLEGPAARSFANIFLTFWKAHYPQELQAPDAVLPEVPPVETDCLVQPFADSPVDRESVAKNVYLELINQAQHKLYICTPYLILDGEVISVSGPDDRKRNTADGVGRINSWIIKLLDLWNTVPSAHRTVTRSLWISSTLYSPSVQSRTACSTYSLGQFTGVQSGQRYPSRKPSGVIANQVPQDAWRTSILSRYPP